MRLFLLPISTRRTLIYCERPKPAPGQSQSYLDRAVLKANATWVDFEKAPSGWKKTLTTYGNMMLRRIPYEEWGLKTIPSRQEGKSDEVEVLFPSLFLKEEERVKETCRTLALERQPLHRKRMIWSTVGAPLTLPFALVPILPNIPGFYLLFRAFSHWKALRGAQHLEWLSNNNLLRPSPSSVLNELYTAGLMHDSRQLSRDAPRPTREQGEEVAKLVESRTNGGEDDVMLLQRWNGKLLAEEFELPEMEVEIERAVEQVEKSLKVKEEAREMKWEGASEKDVKQQ